MTETSKKNSTSKMEEKACLLDEEIGKGFLSSWKSMSMPDDIMDFNFETPDKDKKAFSFEKLDMDFDDNFDKISSFKVDMSDLDLSSPVEIKGKNNGPDKRTHKDKEDHFSFSFEFKELDEFDFGSKIRNGENSSSDGKPNSRVPSGTKECGKTKISHHDKSPHASDDRVAMGISPSENETIFDNETAEGETLNFDQREKIKFSKNISSSRPDKQGGNFLPLPKRTEMDIVADKHRFAEKDSIFTTMYSNKSIIEKDLVQNVDSSSEADICNAKKHDGDHSDGDQIPIVKAITGLQSDPDNANPMLLDSGLLNSIELKNKDSHNDTIICGNSFSARNVNGTPDTIQNKMDHEDTSLITVSKSDPNELKATNATYGSKTNLILSPMNREKFMARTEGVGLVGSRFDASYEQVRHLQHASRLTLKSPQKSVFGKMLQTSTTETRDSFGSSSSLVEKNETESAMGSKEIGFVSSNKSCAGSHDNAGLHSNVLSSPGQLIKSAAERNKAPTPTVSSMDSFRTSILSNSIKFSSACASKRSPAPNFNIPMSRGEGSSTTKHFLVKTAVNLPKIVKEVHRNQSKVLEVDASCEKEMITSAAIEDEKVDALPALNSKKSEPRTPTMFEVGEKDGKGERSGTFGNEEEIRRIPLMNNISEAFGDHKKESKIGGMVIQMELDTTITNVPMVDSHVEMAEAYSKELDAVWATVRKKQEEAKEVLARALVTSSELLLLLNHPIHHHKFDMVQRFADHLMSKPLHRESPVPIP